MPYSLRHVSINNGLSSYITASLLEPVSVSANYAAPQHISYVFMACVIITSICTPCCAIQTCWFYVHFEFFNIAAAVADTSAQVCGPHCVLGRWCWQLMSIQA